MECLKLDRSVQLSREVKHHLEIAESKLTSYKQQKDQEVETLRKQLSESKTKQQEQCESGTHGGQRASLADISALGVQVVTLTDQLQEAKSNLQFENDKTRSTAEQKATDTEESFKEGREEARRECATNIAAYEKRCTQLEEDVNKSRVPVSVYSEKAINLQTQVDSARQMLADTCERG